MSAPTDWAWIVENCPDLVVRLDAAGRYLYVNQRWSETTGISLESCRAKTSREIGLPVGLCEILEFACERVLRDKSLHEFDFPYFGPQGEQHFSSRVIPELDAQGNVTSMVSVTRNITSHMRLAAELAESEARFRAFMDYSPCISWIKDAQGRHVFLSETYQRHFDIRPVDWLGKTDAELWPPDIAKQFQENDRAVLRDGLTREVVEVSRDRRGRQHVWRSFKFLIQDQTGRKYIGGTAVDITRQQRMAADSARLAAIVASTQDAIISKTLDGIIQTWNPGAQRLFGYSDGEMIGRSVLMIIPPELHSQEVEILSRIRRGELVEHYESIRLRNDGTRVPVSLRVSPILDDKGTVIGAAKIVRDLTATRSGATLRLPMTA